MNKNGALLSPSHSKEEYDLVSCCVGVKHKAVICICSLHFSKFEPFLKLKRDGGVFFHLGLRSEPDKTTRINIV
jgi:hypothetical protein